MEAAACRLKQLCPPIGVARDILEPASLFESAAQAAKRIIEEIRHGALNATVQPQFERWKASHTTATLAAGLHKLYDGLPANEAFQSKTSLPKLGRLSANLSQIRFTIRRRTSQPQLPQRVRWNHLPGRHADLDEIMHFVRGLLEELKIPITNSNDSDLEIAGWPIQDTKKPRRIIQWTAPGMSQAEILSGATLVAPSVQDILNLRWAEIWNPAIVLPVPMKPSSESSAPLVVAQDDRNASIEVWRALSAGCPVFHPKGMAYGEQVFWAGITYTESKPDTRQIGCVQPTGIPIAGELRSNLRKLISV
jgi:hypothetical protein